MYCYKCGKQIREDSKFCCHCGATIESSETDSLKNGKNISKKRRIKPVYIILIALAAIITLSGFLSQVGKVPDDWEGESAFGEYFSKLHEELYESPIKSQVVQHYRLKKRVNKNELKSYIDKLYKAQIRRTDYALTRTPDTFMIYIYPHGNYTTRASEWVAMLLKSKNDVHYDITIRENKLDDIGKESEVKYGFAESERRIIFMEIVKCEDKGEIETLFENKTKVAAICKSDLAKKHKITVEQLNMISQEGIYEYWPIESY